MWILYFCPISYIRSLSRCFTWLASGGKSGSSFCKAQGMWAECSETASHFRISYFNFVLNPHTARGCLPPLGFSQVFQRHYEVFSSTFTCLWGSVCAHFGHIYFVIFLLQGWVLNYDHFTKGTRGRNLKIVKFLLDDCVWWLISCTAWNNQQNEKSQFCKGLNGV